LQSWRPVRRVAELGSLGRRTRTAMNEPPVTQKAGLDGKSFLLGILVGALIVSTLGTGVAVLFFLRQPSVILGERAKDVAIAPATPTSPKNPVEGTWFNLKYPQRPCAIVSTPTGFVVTDQNGAISRLEYDPAGVVIATDWRGGLRGDVETNTIRWDHGGVWVRKLEEKQ